MFSRRGFFSMAVLCTAGMLAASLPAGAQVLYGSLVGTVTDSSGALVPDAAVAITNAATGLARNVTANESGRFSLLNVPAGEYEMSVTHTGFRPFSRKGMYAAYSTALSLIVRERMPLRAPCGALAVLIDGLPVSDLLVPTVQLK